MSVSWRSLEETARTKERRRLPRVAEVFMFWLVPLCSHSSDPRSYSLAGLLLLYSLFRWIAVDFDDTCAVAVSDTVVDPTLDLILKPPHCP